MTLEKRFNESAHVVKHIREGMMGAFRGNDSILTFASWSMFDVRATGEKTVNLERLRSITNYNVSDTHPIVERFWNALERMTDEERSSYLKFVWGRNRLPMSLEGLSYKHKIDLCTSFNKNGFPQSHTCFFTLDIPEYETDDMCYKRLVEASSFCGEIDTDGSPSDDLD